MKGPAAVVWVFALSIPLATCWARGPAPFGALAQAGAEWPTPAFLRSVAQAAADAAALAGARSFLDAHDDSLRARKAALELVTANDEGHPRVTLEATNIEMDLHEGTILIELEARGRRIPGALARYAGLGDIRVSVSAAAEAQDVRCVPIGTSPEGYPMERCEGLVKYLRLIPVESVR